MRLGGGNAYATHARAIRHAHIDTSISVEVSDVIRRHGESECSWLTRSRVCRIALIGSRKSRSRYPPAHFPEVGFKSGRFFEDTDELGFPHGRRVMRCQAVEVSARSLRHLLICRAGVLSDPDSIAVANCLRVLMRSKPRRDLGIADHAWCQRNFERQQVAAHPGIKHVARVG